jgi:hypothetical protein
MLQGFRYRFARMYAEFAETPELAKFRRYLQLWSWILNNQIAVIEQKSKECNDAIADIQGVARGSCIYKVTDFHRVYASEEHPILKTQMKDLTDLVRGYGMSLLQPYDLNFL